MWLFIGLWSMIKIALSDQQKNAQISSDPNPTDRIGTSLVISYVLLGNSQANKQYVPTN